MATPSPNDPSGFVTNPPSTIVKIQGTTRDDINGKLGIVVQFQNDRGRYLVHMTSNQTVVSMKPDNLAKASYLEQATAQYEQLCRDPQVQRILNQMQRGLPPGVTLKHAGMAMGALFLLLVYLLGFSRTMMLVSFTMLFVMMIGPDLVAGADRQTIIRNAPMRFKTMVRDQFPGGSYIADKPYALAGLAIFMVVFFIKSMMPVGTRAAAAAGSAAMSDMPQPSRNLAQKTAEEYYKLGFDDATAQKEYGTSLPDLTKSTPNYDMLDDLPDYPMPPPTKNAGLLGKFGSISNVMSMMFLGKTVIGLGSDPASGGGWSFELFKNNLMTLEPWRLGLMGMSLFGVVSSLMGR